MNVVEEKMVMVMMAVVMGLTIMTVLAVMEMIRVIVTEVVGW